MRFLAISCIAVLGLPSIAAAESLDLTIEMIQEYAYQAKNKQPALSPKLQSPNPGTVELNYNEEGDLLLTREHIARYAEVTGSGIANNTFLADRYRHYDFPLAYRDRFIDNAYYFFQKHTYWRGGLRYARGHLRHVLGEYARHGYRHGHHHDCHVCNRFYRRIYNYRDFHRYTRAFVPSHFFYSGKRYRVYKEFEGRRGYFNWHGRRYYTDRFRFNFANDEWRFYRKGNDYHRLHFE